METQKKHTYRRHVSLTFNAIIAGMLITGSSFSQTVWQETTTGLEETRYLKKIAFGAGKFVALGQMTNGITLISTDGQFWSHVDIGTTNALRGVAFVGNMFVAVGEAGTLTTSPDGSSWTTRSSGVTENLNATAHGNGLFLAIGENGAITRSADGATWTPAASLTNSHHGIVFGNGTFVAVGSDADSANACGQGVIISSTDGLSWTNKSIHTGAHPLEAAFGNSMFVTSGADISSAIYVPDVGYVCIGGSRNILASRNAEDWTTVTNGTGWQRGVCFGDNSFVSVGDNEIVTSADGLTWRRTYYSSPGPIFLSGVAFGNGRFVAVGGGRVMVSPADSPSSQTTIPVSFSLQSYSSSQGGTIFSRDKATFWSGGGGAGKGRGFNVAVADPSNCTFEEAKNFDTWLTRETGEAHRNLVAYLESIPNGKLVLVAVGDEAGLTFWGDSRCTRLPYDWVEGVIGKLQSYGSTNIATYCYNDSWGMIFIKGQTSPMAEGLESGSILPTAPVRLFTTFPLTISKPVVSISIENTGFGGDRYMLTVTNVVPGRDIEIQYSDRLPLSWKHLQTLNDPPTNFVQRSDLTMPNSSRFLRALMDASAHMPPGF